MIKVIRTLEEQRNIIYIPRSSFISIIDMFMQQKYQGIFLNDDTGFYYRFEDQDGNVGIHRED